MTGLVSFKKLAHGRLTHTMGFDLGSRACDIQLKYQKSDRAQKWRAESFEICRLRK